MKTVSYEYFCLRNVGDTLTFATQKHLQIPFEVKDRAGSIVEAGRRRVTLAPFDNARNLVGSGRFRVQFFCVTSCIIWHVLSDIFGNRSSFVARVVILGMQQ